MLSLKHFESLYKRYKLKFFIEFQCVYGIANSVERFFLITVMHFLKKLEHNFFFENRLLFLFMVFVFLYGLLLVLYIKRSRHISQIYGLSLGYSRLEHYSHTGNVPLYTYKTVNSFGHRYFLLYRSE